MSNAGASNGARSSADESLVVVRVEDAIDPRLAGWTGAVYESPPQPRGQAIALVGLLVGHADESTGDEPERRVAAVAGGQRIVTLSPTPRAAVDASARALRRGQTGAIDTARRGQTPVQAVMQTPEHVRG